MEQQPTGVVPVWRSAQKRTEHKGVERVKKKRQPCSLLNEEAGLMHNTEWTDAAAGRRDQMTREIGLP